MSKEECKLCGTQTENRFNIDFKAVPVCEGCATTIFLQQAQWYAKNAHTTPEPESQKLIGVIAKTVKNFHEWAEDMEDRFPKMYNFKKGVSARELINTKTNVRYIGLTQSNHVCGYAFYNLLKAPEAHTNPQYENILKYAQPTLMDFRGKKRTCHYMLEEEQCCRNVCDEGHGNICQFYF